MAQPKTVRREGATIHFSVGALIIKGSKVLLIDRAQPPFGLAGPAGHIDEGEEPAAALKREVQEETGLSVQTCTLVGEEFIAWNTCSLGVKGHFRFIGIELATEMHKEGILTLEEFFNLPAAPNYP